MPKVDLPTLGRDAIAGVMSAAVQIAYCITFSALIFQGSLASGFALGLGMLIMATVVTGFVVALTSTLSPAQAGPDTPAVAVMSVLAGTIAGALSAKGASEETIIFNVLVGISLSTLLTGFFLYGLGSLRLGQSLRFIPYPVIAGFLAASGWLLITGSVEVITQANVTLSPASWPALQSSHYAPQLIVGLLFALTIAILKRWIPAYLALPIAFIGFLLAIDIFVFGFTGEAQRAGWFLPSLGKPALWLPIGAAFSPDVDWIVLGYSSAEIGAVCGVTAISLLLDVTSLEVARQKLADLDKEFRTNGIANILSAVAGGAGGNLSLNGAILLEEAGAITRWAGVFTALICAVVLFVGADITHMVPKAVLAGMLAYLGAMMLAELLRFPAQRSWTDWALASTIMLVIVNFGYLLGVVLGVISACLTFALSYSRIGVIRHHLTRKQFSSNVERGPERLRVLREEGDRIHVFWLSGFIFFGSSNGLFEFIRRAIDMQREKPITYVVLDFSGVPGLDTSAVLSLIKLRHYCNESGVILAFSGVTEAMHGGLEGSCNPHQIFASRNEALEWCEDMILMHHDEDAARPPSLESWLTAEFGGTAEVSRIIPYLQRHELDPGDVLFRQGEAADSIDIIASGRFAVTMTDGRGHMIRLRRMVGYMIVGEMGFYRQVPRTATVIAEDPSVVYRLTREAFDRMQTKDPAAATGFHKLIIRLLSDRVESSDRALQHMS